MTSKSNNTSTSNTRLCLMAYCTLLERIKITYLTIFLLVRWIRLDSSTLSLIIYAIKWKLPDT